MEKARCAYTQMPQHLRFAASNSLTFLKIIRGKIIFKSKGFYLPKTSLSAALFWMTTHKSLTCLHFNEATALTQWLLLMHRDLARKGTLLDKVQQHSPVKLLVMWMLYDYFPVSHCAASDKPSNSWICYYFIVPLVPNKQTKPTPFLKIGLFSVWASIADSR